MSQFYPAQQFVESLIALKDHYQSLQAEKTQEKNHALQQLAHVDALLTDGIVQEQGWLESLLQLRSQYQDIVSQCDRQLSNAKEQLHHVNALLADQLMQQYERQMAIAEVSVDKQEKQLACNGSANAEWRSLKESAPLDEELLFEEVEKSEQLGIFSESNTPIDSADVEEESALNEQETAEVEDEPELGLINAPVVKRQEPQSRSPMPKTPMLAKFENLTKLQALKSITEEKAGSILSTEWLVRALHGELELEVAEQEKPRTAQALRDGAEQGLWQQVPRQAGYYTLDMQLVEQGYSVAGQRQADAAALTMLPRYDKLKLIDAVGLIISDKAGEALMVETVVQQLYGELSEPELSKVKKSVENALWRGTQAKRWQKVRRGQRVAYTLNSRLLAPTGSTKS